MTSLWKWQKHDLAIGGLAFYADNKKSLINMIESGYMVQNAHDYQIGSMNFTTGAVKVEQNFIRSDWDTNLEYTDLNIIDHRLNEELITRIKGPEQDGQMNPETRVFLDHILAYAKGGYDEYMTRDENAVHSELLKDNGHKTVLRIAHKEENSDALIFSQNTWLIEDKEEADERGTEHSVIHVLDERHYAHDGNSPIEYYALDRTLTIDPQEEERLKKAVDFLQAHEITGIKTIPREGMEFAVMRPVVAKQSMTHWFNTTISERHVHQGALTKVDEINRYLHKAGEGYLFTENINDTDPKAIRNHTGITDKNTLYLPEVPNGKDIIDLINDMADAVKEQDIRLPETPQDYKTVVQVRGWLAECRSLNNTSREPQAAVYNELMNKSDTHRAFILMNLSENDWKQAMAVCTQEAVVQKHEAKETAAEKQKAKKRVETMEERG